MPRNARTKSCTGIYHIMLRGINKQTIFEDDEDRRRLLETLKKYKEICKFELYAYCLMDNHIHLLIKETEESISDSIKRICSSYVYWYNTKYDRCGHLFQDRFKSEKVETERYFLTVLRYIHQNPIKAGLAKTVFDCRWTSIHEYAGKAHFVTQEKGLSLFHEDRKIAIKQITAYMEEDSEEQCLDYQVRTKVTDSQVSDYLRTLGISDKNKIQQMDKKERSTVLNSLKELNGVSIRQISRVTGISKSVIDRVGH